MTQESTKEGVRSSKMVSEVFLTRLLATKVSYVSAVCWGNSMTQSLLKKETEVVKWCQKSSSPGC